MRHTKGFTLIELLMVIAIISLIASIVIGSLSDAREKGRDSVRLQQMSEIQKAIEIYYADHGEYPSMLKPDGTTPIDQDITIPTGDNWSCFSPPVGYENYSCFWTESTEDFFLWQLWDTANNGGVAYIGSKPVDVAGDSGSYEYFYRSQNEPTGWGDGDTCNAQGGKWYILYIQNLEGVDTNPHQSSPGFECGSINANAWGAWVTGNTSK